MQRLGITSGISQKGIQGKLDRTNPQIEASGFDLCNGRIIGVPINRFELDDVARPEKHHVLLQIGQTLLRIVDRSGRDAEHLVTTCSAHRVDAAEAAAVTQRKLGCIGTWPQVFGHLQLALAFDHLKHERQTGHKTDHRDEPRRAAMSSNKGIDIRQIIDPRSVFQVRRTRVLVAVTETHQGFMGPRIVVKHRNFDDSGLQGTLSDRTGLGSSYRFEQCLRCNTVRVEADLERSIGQAHVQHTVQRQALDRTGYRQPLEKCLQRHTVTDLGEQMFISAKAVANRISHVCSFLEIVVERQANISDTARASARTMPFDSARRTHLDTCRVQRLAGRLGEVQRARCVAVQADRIKFDIQVLTLDGAHQPLQASANHARCDFGRVQGPDVAGKNDRAAEVVIAISVELANHWLAQLLGNPADHRTGHAVKQ
ncbi:Uncharacterized protein ALO80_05929 [Pseudomonas caricapapayae]|nr:Uncharacterized protein ALO80_05929 [Pseudomonas caricapapayae]